MLNRRQLEQKLERIDAMLKDAEGRMPAHSAKPAMMQRIFELEDERDAIVRKLNALSAK